MTRDQLWAAYCKRNPAFTNDDATVTLPVRGLRKLFEQTWDQAEESKKAARVKPSEFDDFLDILKKR